MCVRLFVCESVSVYVCMTVCVCLHMCVCVCVCLYVSVCVHLLLHNWGPWDLPPGAPVIRQVQPKLQADAGALVLGL